MPTPLPQDDVVSLCLTNLANLLQPMSVRYLMINGKIESPLAGFLGIAWEGSGVGARAYSMDKRPFGYELDFLAVENQQPIFWSNLKCSFAEDWGDTNNCVKDVLRQAAIRERHIFDADLPCPRYIIHFLTGLPNQEENLLLQAIKDKFDALRRPRYRPTDLKFIYETFLPGQFESTGIIPIWSHPDGKEPTVFAIAIKLT